MDRDKAVKVTDLVHRIEMLEHQLDFLEGLATYEPKYIDFKDLTNGYGIFTEEDKNDLIEMTNKKLEKAKRELDKM